MIRRLLDVSSGTRLLSCVIICGIIARPLRMMFKRNQRYSMKNDKLKLEYATRGECRKWMETSMQPIERSAQNISTCGSNWLQWRKKLEPHDQLHGTRFDWEKFNVWPSEYGSPELHSFITAKKQSSFSVLSKLIDSESCHLKYLQFVAKFVALE